jgi:predicted nuclease of predicted toxin-antitoxin system
VTHRLLADEHIARKLLVGLRRVVEDVDIVRVQDVGLRTFDDPTILAWAADAGRALVTQDIRTIPDFAHERVAAGLPMPGIFVLPTMMPVGTAIDELAVIVEASEASEWVSRVVYLPLR